MVVISSTFFEEEKSAPQRKSSLENAYAFGSCMPVPVAAAMQDRTGGGGSEALIS